MSRKDGEGSVNTIERWSVPEAPVAIDYLAPALREIAVYARDAAAVPSGAEAEGVLFGSRGENLVTIAAWRPIDLSTNDPEALNQLLAAAKSDPGLQGLHAVGWFASHVRTKVRPSESDVTAFNYYFPRDWQTMLVVEPRRDGSTLAAFFVRGPEGALQPESRQEPLRLDAEPLGQHPLQALQTPSLEPEPRLRRHWLYDRRRWIWAVPAILAVLVIAMLLDRPKANPTPSLGLHVVDERGGVRLAWDKNAEAIRKARSGLLEIHDGQGRVEFRLERDKLQQGAFSYARKSGDLELKLTVYGANNSPVQESARFIGPPPGRERAEDPAEVRRQRDGLQVEAGRLREALRKETRRNRQLEDAVRILENRWEVEHPRKSYRQTNRNK